jgi:hypothetical protein
MSSGNQRALPGMQRGTSDWRLAVSDASHGTPIAMLENNLRILQLNTMKSGAGMEALINDHQSQKLDVLLIQEPSITACLPNTREPQRLYQPTVESDSVRFRSLIYVNRKLSTSYHRQVRCNHPDMNAHWDIYSNRTPRPLSLKVSEIR